MAIGWWVDLAEADSYFQTERLDSSAWDTLLAFDSTGLYQERALLQAYNRIHYSPDYSTPEFADATASQLFKLKRGQGELAYYLAVHLRDEDVRKGLQAQGVIKAGVIKEDYLAAYLARVPFPAAVEAWLSDFAVIQPTVYTSNLERDEEEDVETKIHDFK